MQSPLVDFIRRLPFLEDDNLQGSISILDVIGDELNFLLPKEVRTMADTEEEVDELATADGDGDNDSSHGNGGTRDESALGREGHDSDDSLYAIETESRNVDQSQVCDNDPDTTMEQDSHDTTTEHTLDTTTIMDQTGGRVRVCEQSSNDYPDTSIDEGQESQLPAGSGDVSMDMVDQPGPTVPSKQQYYFAQRQDASSRGSSKDIEKGSSGLPIVVLVLMITASTNWSQLVKLRPWASICAWTQQ